jgi:polyhydroxybutyrate depolymerase
MTPNVRTAARLFILASVILLAAFRGGSGIAVQAAESSALAPPAACARGTDETRKLSNKWGSRQYTVHLPPSYSRRIPYPVVIDIHGGSGNKESARLSSCPDRDPDSPGCLDRLADCEGFIVVYPDGTQESGLPKGMRSFNAGGGANGYVCIAGDACTTDVDDVRFFGDLIDALKRHYRIDPNRVHVAGLSNGAAMSHRLACELSDRVASIAAVGGGNQYATSRECAPGRSVPVLQIHGTADRCFPYDGGYERCTLLQPYGFRVSVADTVAGWVGRNGCGSTPVVEDWPDADPDDGTTVTQMRYPDCSGGGDVTLLRVNGGGHTWPGGSDNLPDWIVGKVSREFSANQVMWEFFKAHPLR